jgi:hypothetical protein
MTKMTLVRNLREEEFILVHGSPRCQSMVAWPHVFGKKTPWQQEYVDMKYRERQKGTGDKTLPKTHLSDLLPPARSRLLKFAEPRKIAPPDGDQVPTP